MNCLYKTCIPFSVKFFLVLWWSGGGGGGVAAPANVIILSVHVGANPLYGYYAAAPVYRVAVRHIRRRWPESLALLSHTSIYLPGFDLCADAGDQIAAFFAEYYFKELAVLNDAGSYLVLASPGIFSPITAVFFQKTPMFTEQFDVELQCLCSIKVLCLRI